MMEMGMLLSSGTTATQILQSSSGSTASQKWRTARVVLVATRFGRSFSVKTVPCSIIPIVQQPQESNAREGLIATTKHHTGAPFSPREGLTDDKLNPKIISNNKSQKPSQGARNGLPGDRLQQFLFAAIVYNILNSADPQDHPAAVEITILLVFLAPDSTGVKPIIDRLMQSDNNLKVPIFLLSCFAFRIRGVSAQVDGEDGVLENADKWALVWGLLVAFTTIEVYRWIIRQVQPVQPPAAAALARSGIGAADLAPPAIAAALAPTIAAPAVAPPAIAGPALAPAAIAAAPAAIAGAPLPPAAIAGAPLPPAAIAGAPLPPAAIAGAPLAPVAIVGAPLAPAAIAGAPLAPAAIAAAALAPAAIAGAALAPAAIAAAALAPAAIAGAALAPAAIAGAPLPPAAIAGAPLAPVAIVGAPLAPAAIAVAPLAPGAIAAAALAPAAIAGAALAPAAIAGAALAPAAIAGAALAPAAIAGPAFPPPAIAGPIPGAGFVLDFGSGAPRVSDPRFRLPGIFDGMDEYLPDELFQ